MDLKTFHFYLFLSAGIAGAEKSEELRKNARLLTLHLPPFLMVKWNATTGHASQINGLTTHYIEWIALRFKFTYSWLPVGRNLLVEDSPTERGLTSYLTNDNADAIISGISPSADRRAFIDFSLPITEVKVSLLIPSPIQSLNQKAIFMPFQKEVWLSLLGSITAVICMLYLVGLALDVRTPRNRTTGTGYHKKRLIKWVAYAFSVLLGQSAYYEGKALAIRLIAIAWCLATFVIVPAYSGNLTSFLMSPSVTPIIKSVYDINNVPGLKVAVNRGFGADLVFTLFAKDSKTLLGRMSAEFLKTILRCNTTDVCLDGVRSGQYVFVQGDKIIDNIVVEERKRMGVCTFAKAKESFLTSFLTFAIQKRSPFLHRLNKGILEMDAMGISNYWKKKYFYEAKECNNPLKNLHLRGLYLAEFATTFLLFGVGCGLGFMTFLFELLRSAFLKQGF